jgi:hypothetical protein
MAFFVEKRRLEKQSLCRVCSDRTAGAMIRFTHVNGHHLSGDIDLNNFLFIH